MDKLFIKNRIITIIVVSFMAITLLPATVFGAATVKMTTYNEVVKSKNTAYCSTNKGLYKVDISTKTSTRLTKTLYSEFFGGPYNMKLHKNYIYYVIPYGENYEKLYRISTNGKNKKFITNVCNSYVIKGNTLYAKTPLGIGRTKSKRMTLKGNNKKTTSRKIKMVRKKTNCSGYELNEIVLNKKWNSSDEGYDVIVGVFLKTPQDNIYICQYESWEDCEDYSCF